MTEKKRLETIFRKHGIDFKWISAKDIVVAEWVRVKCTFACGNYGLAACCPPNVPSVEECARFFQEYKDAVVLHFEKEAINSTERSKWVKAVEAELLEVEREVFLSGYQKTFLLSMGTCYLCKKCQPTREACRNKEKSRPTPEAFAVDVFSTVRKIEYPIKVLTSYSQTMNRYAFLLIE